MDYKVAINAIERMRKYIVELEKEVKELKAVNKLDIDMDGNFWSAEDLSVKKTYNCPAFEKVREEYKDKLPPEAPLNQDIKTNDTGTSKII